MDINIIRELYIRSNIRWSAHCLERMQERDINRCDVKNCIMNGEIIEEYPSDFPHPSCLIFGTSIKGRVIHAVVGTDGSYVYIITVYYPDIIKFEADLKTRRTK